jgi:glycine oxidase
MAGGMLAPWCERASTDAAVLTLGEPSIDWWMRRFSGTVRKGSLVVAPPRDAAELTRFAERTERFDWLDETQIG